MPMSRDTGRIVTLSLLSAFLWVIISDDRLSSPEKLSGDLFFNCYSCDAAKTACTLHLTQGVGSADEVCKYPIGENGDPLKDQDGNLVSYSPSCAAACDCPSGTWPCDELACLAAFTEVTNWTSYKPTASQGFDGSVFADPYMLFVPSEGEKGSHGTAVVYNTQLALNAPSSWKSVDLTKFFGSLAAGFRKGGFDGTHAYLAPGTNASGPSAAVARVNMTKDVTQASSWEMTDPSTFAATGLNAALLPSSSGFSTAARGYNGAIFDGNYMYFVPDTNGDGPHANVMRYEVSKPFASASSWQVFSPSVNSKGYAGALYDGRYVYFIPKGNEKNLSTMHGEVLRYDTRASFSADASWTTFDPSSNGLGAAARGYNGGVFDGTYLYFAPYQNGNGPHSKVLRYNVTQPFDSISSWSSFDVSASVDSNAKGYIGAAFDGQFVYFSPYFNGKDSNGRLLRYNSKESFEDRASWTTFDANFAESGTAGFSSLKMDDSSVLSFTATGPRGEKSADGTLSLSENSRVTFDWECPGSNFTNPELGLKATNVSCAFEGGGNVINNVPQYGAGSSIEASVTGDGTYSIKCGFERYNDDVRYPVVLCSRTIDVRFPSSAESAAAAAASAAVTVTGPNGEVPDENGIITVPKGSKVTLDWNCPDTTGGVNGYAFEEVFQSAGCDVSAGGATYRYSVDGAGSVYSVTASQNMSVTLNCNWSYGRPGFSNKTVQLCSKNVSVQVTE